MTVFDRTWYGRVMVERLEGFCTEEEWKRAYQEINELEYELQKWGAILIKFWLHIDLAMSSCAASRNGEDAGKTMENHG